MQRSFTNAWGAHVLQGAARFRLWAPAARTVSAVLLDEVELLVPMTATGGGWFECVDERARAGTRYLFEIDGSLRVADPASRFQPEGPERASEVVDPRAFDWPPDAPVLAPLQAAVIYELHVGTFTPEGTYDAAASRLDHLAALGVTAIELMPLSQAPGLRNWGYDGVLHYAPSHVYGRPESLKRFIVEAHARGLAVLLDVVYNHFGPQGNYLSRYAPQFFSDRIRTPWGAGIDYSSPGNDPVRSYAIDNACYWLAEYGFDGLRLDAAPMIVDSRPRHVLDELLDAARQTAGRPVYLIAEDVKNEAPQRIARFDARWSDDAHHALHVAVTGERSEYFSAFASAPVDRLGAALTSNGIARIDYLQNHDQIGNRPFGERITRLASAQAVRAAAAVLLLAPPVPLLFMGEEWAASTPFLFFCDFEPNLAKRIAQGRREEFQGLAEFQDPAAPPIPDPSAPQSFECSRLHWDELEKAGSREWLAFYRELLRVRRTAIAPRLGQAANLEADYDLIGAAGLLAWWTLPDGARLRLEANLTPQAQSGFDERRGNAVFATHGPEYEGGTAPPWSVRWTFGE